MAVRIDPDLNRAMVETVARLSEGASLVITRGYLGHLYLSARKAEGEVYRVNLSEVLMVEGAEITLPGCDAAQLARNSFTVE